MKPDHGDVIVIDGKATQQFQYYLDDLEATIVSIPPNLDDGKVRKRVVNLWFNETDNVLEYEVL